MAWPLPQLLDRPVLHWELVRMLRGPWPGWLRYGYAAWLFLQFLVLFSGFRPESYDTGSGYSRNPTELDSQRQEAAAGTAFATYHVSLLLQQQLLLLVLLTPAVTAGALGHEKERDTLSALFGTQLGAWEIVSGKLLGRLAVLAYPALAALPLLVSLAVLADLSVGRLLFALAQAAVLTFALAAVSMLSSVWTRRTSDAILGCYAALVLTFLARLVFLATVPLPAWLDPVQVLQQLTTPGSQLHPGSLLLHLGVWGGAGGLCLALATARLRPASLHQLEKRPGRWLWAFRPRVGDDPIRWRERYVLGLAPLPWLRLVPGWMAMLGVLTFSAIVAGTALEHAAGRALFLAFRRGDLALGWRLVLHANLEWVWQEVNLMGTVLLVIGAVVVGVRSATSIAEEKRRKTWQDLVLTPLSLAEIVRGKRWGVAQAAVPYVIVYSLPMFALAALEGPSGFVQAGILLILACLVMLGAAWLGLAGVEEGAGGVPMAARRPWGGRPFSLGPNCGNTPVQMFEGVVRQLPPRGVPDVQTFGKVGPSYDVWEVQGVGDVGRGYDVWLRFRATAGFIDGLIADGFVEVPWPKARAQLRLPEGYDLFRPGWSPRSLTEKHCYRAKSRRCAWSVRGGSQWLLVDRATGTVYLFACGE